MAYWWLLGRHYCIVRVIVAANTCNISTVWTQVSQRMPFLCLHGAAAWFPVIIPFPAMFCARAFSVTRLYALHLPLLSNACRVIAASFSIAWFRIDSLLQLIA